MNLNIDIVLRNHDDTPSGGRKIIYSYANHLAERGHHVSLWFLGDTPFFERQNNRLKTIFHWEKYEKIKKIQKKVTWFQINQKVKIKTGFHLPKSFGLNDNCIIAFDYGIALYLHSHFPYLQKKIIHFIQADERVYDNKFVVEKAWKLPTTKIVVSTWLKTLLSQYCSSVYLVPNFLEEKKFFLEKPVELRDKVVCLINHPNPSKGTAEGLKVIKMAKEKIPNLKILMFGNGEKPLDLDGADFYFQRATTRQLRQQVYNQSAIYLQMSHSEGWGLTATEAMACGCALLSAENGGISDFAVNNKSAIIFQNGNIEVASNLLVYLLENQENRISIANNGMKNVKKYTLIKSLFELEKVLNLFCSGT